jgi:DNA-directed RNA polymerase subunit omega
MARVTVEDCLEQVPNRFALTVLASRRARALGEGRGTALVECDNKDAVTALREIAATNVRFTEDVDAVVRGFINEQRTRYIRAVDADHTFIDAATFSIDEEDGEPTVQELEADLTRLAAAAAEAESAENDENDESEATKADDDASPDVEDLPDTAATAADGSDDGDE